MTAPTTATGRDHRRREDGASLVEFALILPLLVMMLLGITTGGFALATKNSMTNAVREGARVGATLPEGGDWSTGWADDVKGRVVELAGGDLEDTEVCVELVDVDDSTSPPTETLVGRYPSGGCVLSMTTPSTPDTAVGCVVKVWAERDAELNALFLTQTVDLQARAVGMYERDDCP